MLLIYQCLDPSFRDVDSSKSSHRQGHIGHWLCDFIAHCDYVVTQIDDKHAASSQIDRPGRRLLQYYTKKARSAVS